MDGTFFSVRIQYREPGCERRRGWGPRPYHITYQVHAANEDEAKVQAVKNFDEDDSCSGVGWPKFVTEVQLVGA